MRLSSNDNVSTNGKHMEDPASWTTPNIAPCHRAILSSEKAPTRPLAYLNPFPYQPSALWQQSIWVHMLFVVRQGVTNRWWAPLSMHITSHGSSRDKASHPSWLLSPWPPLGSLPRTLWGITHHQLLHLTTQTRPLHCNIPNNSVWHTTRLS